jgi:N6-L-threonylcarbamoyladenine synthase
MSSLQTFPKPTTKKQRLPKKGFLILAIETSCDETAIAILQTVNGLPTILSNQISSQVKLHAKWGGVVPNLAAREHVKNIDLLLKTALAEAKILPVELDAISVTQGPGLIPALLVGLNYAKTLSYLWEKPLIGIHHIEGHIYANFVGAISNFQFPISKQIQKSQISNFKQTRISEEIKKDTTSKISNFKFQISNLPNIKFPILCLVVSGGHTQLVLMKNHLDYEIIGQTVDDAVGEAFDKVARILGIGYPGGPSVALWARKHQKTNNKQQTNSNDQISNNLALSLRECNHSKQSRTLLSSGSPQIFEYKNLRDDNKKTNLSKKLTFPRPMLNKQGFNFSFSGLKTAVLYEVKKFVAANGSSTPTKGVELPKDYIAQVCDEFEQACVDVLVTKTLRAAEKYAPQTILLAGGVSANIELRGQLGQAIEKNLPNVSYCVPELMLTGDNAAMIGVAGAFRWERLTDAQKKSALENWKTLQPNANLKMQ